MQKYLLLHGTANTIAPPPVLYLSPYPRTAQSGNKYEKNAHGTGLEITPRCPNNGVYVFDQYLEVYLAFFTSTIFAKLYPASIVIACAIS